MSRRQARWIEYLSHYYTINYVKRENNLVTDVLLCMSERDRVVVDQVLMVEKEKTTLQNIKEVYRKNLYTMHLLADAKLEMLSTRVVLRDSLLFVEKRLIISDY